MSLAKEIKPKKCKAPGCGQRFKPTMAIFGAYCIVRGIRVSNRRKKEQGQ